MWGRGTWLAIGTVLVALATSTAGIAVASNGAASIASHHKKKHHKAKPHKTTPPKKNQLEGCSTTVSGGATSEPGVSFFQVILGCERGEFSAFQVSTNRTVTPGSITARLGTRFTYTCQQTSSTSFSCSGVNAVIPPNESGALRVFFKSPQAACVSGALESATITMGGTTYTAKVGEAGESSCPG